MPRPVLLRHPSSLDHDLGEGHPERPARILAIDRALQERGWLGMDVRESPQATRTMLEAVHPPAHVDRIEAIDARGGGQIDGDTSMSSGSLTAALHAAGGAVALVDALLSEGAPWGASVHRPPGHHAEAAQAMGFCLFNNIAIAAQHALDAHGLTRVMIVDWDVHHGNGTNDIFHASDRVLFLSIHESPLYPGSGPADDAGSGPGLGYTVNLPVPGGSGDATFVSLVAHVAAPLLVAFAPQLLLVSAGYDAHAGDPLADCEVTDDGYLAMAAVLRAAAAAAGIPVGVVLEGGYDLTGLAGGMLATCAALGALEPLTVEVPVHPLAHAARERAATWWPDLGVIEH